MPDVPMPVRPGNLAPRELSALVQTNVTFDHDLALEWAATAFRSVMNPHVRFQDPTLAAEISRNAALRAELGGRPPSEVSVWLTNSAIYLIGDSPRVHRERAASMFIGASVLHHQVHTGRNNIRADLINRRFHQAFNILDYQNPSDEPQDRYLTMLLRRWSAFASDETIDNPDPKLAFVAAIAGVYCAIFAEREGNTLRAYKKFVFKHAGANALAGLVAITYPFRNIPVAKSIRRKAQDKLIG